MTAKMEVSLLELFWKEIANVCVKRDTLEIIVKKPGSARSEMEIEGVKKEGYRLGLQEIVNVLVQLASKEQTVRINNLANVTTKVLPPYKITSAPAHAKPAQKVKNVKS